ncbi:hypothetical protein [Pseudalkalibacillus caeni]|uniref:Uncharacterized protein n=1 Tax=Exobacillus caeni TaxID=2574798 RepID=A0A5R9EZP1_9BACL|nr:hypothetical protein [Pseudalkalibacillus caeni]TLS36812.1 hypothetical protein FCL54_12710 [Pseudalkalibacillus caeni]
MRKFLSRYSHWFSFSLVAFSFITLFINFKNGIPRIVAIIMGGIGLAAVAYLSLLTERHIRKQKEYR